MTFRDGLGKAATWLQGEVSQKIEQAEEKRARWERCGDEQLLRKLHHTHGYDRAVLLTILKDRGYEGEALRDYL